MNKKSFERTFHGLISIPRPTPWSSLSVHYILLPIRNSLLYFRSLVVSFRGEKFQTYRLKTLTLNICPWSELGLSRTVWQTEKPFTLPMGTKNSSSLRGSKLSGFVLNFNFPSMTNKESRFYHSCKIKTHFNTFSLFSRSYLIGKFSLGSSATCITF